MCGLVLAETLNQTSNRLDHGPDQNLSGNTIEITAGTTGSLTGSTIMTEGRVSQALKDILAWPATAEEAATNQHNALTLKLDRIKHITGREP